MLGELITGLIIIGLILFYVIGTIWMAIDWLKERYYYRLMDYYHTTTIYRKRIERAERKRIAAEKEAERVKEEFWQRVVLGHNKNRRTK